MHDEDRIDFRLENWSKIGRIEQRKKDVDIVKELIDSLPDILK